MKKILSILFALVLVVSFSLVTAVPVSAAGTPTIDGAIGTGEWDGAASFDLKGYTAYVTNDDDFMYVAFDYAVTTGSDFASFNVYKQGAFTPDVINAPNAVPLGIWTEVIDGVPGPPFETERLWDTVTDDTPTDGTFTFAEWDRHDGTGRFVSAVNTATEMKVPLAELGVAPRDSIKMIFVLNHNVTGAHVYPEGASSIDPNTYTTYSARVKNETTGLYYQIIQAAIDTASPNDTISAGVGVYNEAVLIDESLTLQGEDRETTIIESPGETLEPTLTISANGVTVSGFTIHSMVYLHGIEYTIDVQGDSAQLTDLHVIKDKPGGGAAVIVRPGVDGFAFTDSTVDSEWNGVYVPRHLATFSSNILIQKVNFNYPGEWAVLLVAMEGAKIEENLFNCENHYGIVTNACDNIEILNNQFVGSDTANLGIWPQGFAGPVGNLTIRGNDISGFNTGINMGEELVTAGVSLTDNTFQDNDIQVFDGAEVLDIQQVLDTNTFDRAVTVDHASLLPTIWSSIQDGVVAAQTGDTVIVAAGTYTENVDIDESLTLQGEDRETTEIKFGYGSYPSASPLTISADGVKVSGFTIRSGPYIEPAWTIAVGGNSAELTDLHVIKEPLLWANNTPRIGGAAIFVAPGLEGFDFTESVVDSAWNGIYAREGSSDILVKKVDFTYPGEYAILLKAITGATIEENTFTCTADKLGVIVTRGSDEIEIEGNQFVGSGSAESHIGILLQAYAEGTMGEVVIVENEISKFHTGILVEDVATSGISIHYNNITGNTCGVKYIGNPNTLDATNNWWNHPTGPTASSGSGDPVSGNVLYNPWLLEPVVPGEPLPTTFDKTLTLLVDWTLVSTDNWIGPAATVGEGVILAITYTPSLGWFEVDPAALVPVNAMYLKTVDGGGLGITYSGGVPVASSKDLEAGWNLISSATLTDAKAVLSPLRFVQVGEEQGVGLATLVSQGVYNLHTGSFYLATLTNDDWGNLEEYNLNPFDGYWVYMNAAKNFGVVPSAQPIQQF